jgi:two-component system sensor histidine kinase/response regulator
MVKYNKPDIENAHVNESHFLKLFIESIPEKVYFKNKKSEFLLVNHKFLKVHGLKNANEALGKTDFDYFRIEHAQKAFDDEQKIINTGIPLLNFEEKETWKSGEITWISTSKMPLKDEKGNIIGTFGISKDITERKHFENEIRKNREELIKLNATKDKFFSIIAHDLRNPFNALIGFSDLLIQSLQEKEYQSALNFSKFISESSKQGFNLLNNLLEWSRSQSGKIAFNKERLNLFELVNESIFLINNSAEQKKIELKIEIDSNIFINADLNMLYTVFRNLICNAVKYTPEGGIITIGAEKETGFVKLYVSDTGIGISEDDIDKLFSLEENYTTKGTNDEKGSGLGLILCKDFIERHGGEIFVQSKLGEGSQFIFTIPSNTYQL